MVDVGTVAGDEGVLRADLPVDLRCADPEALRSGDVGDGADRITTAIKSDSVDDGEVVDRAVLESHGEVRVLFADGPAELEAIPLFANSCFAGGERVAGVHPRTAIGGEESAVIRGLAGFGVNLNAAAAKRRL